MPRPRVLPIQTLIRRINRHTASLVGHDHQHVRLLQVPHESTFYFQDTKTGVVMRTGVTVEIIEKSTRKSGTLKPHESLETPPRKTAWEHILEDD
jgi:hypothetical protein